LAKTGGSPVAADKFMLKNAIEPSIVEEVKKPIREMSTEKFSDKSMLKNNLQDSGASSGIMEQLMNTLKLLLSPLLGEGVGPGVRNGINGYKPNSANPVGTVAQQASLPPIQNRLDLKLTSTTNLMVDGRVLASIVKPYLAADLLRTNESGGTITRSYVI